MAKPSPAQGSTVVPCLMYRDAQAMIDWLCRVIGFEKKAIYQSDDGTIVHSELTLGAGMVMVYTAPEPGDDSTWARLVRQPAQVGGVETQSPSVYVADPDGVYERARASGAEILQDIEDKDYGGRGFTCRDLEGHLWAIGSYDPWA